MDDENIMDVDYPFNDRLGPCEVCGLKESIYTCPKCEVKTCCLKCVRIHKKELDCDGIRDKTKFIRLNNFSNLDLLSDYRLLEQATRTVERCKRNPNTCFKNRGTQNQAEHLPLHLYRLNAACIRRNTSLKFLPKEFTRRKSNTTFLDWKTQTIHWKIEWMFPLDDGNTIKLIDDKCSENDTFGLILQKYFDEPENYKQLEYYQSKGINGVSILLKAEQKQGGKSFYELELTNCIKDSFKYKIIIENPTIFVIFKEHLSLYKLINADEERETLLKESTTDPIKNETDKNENIMSNILNVKNSIKRRKNKKNNLLFINTSDESDNDSDANQETDDSLEIKIPKRMFKIEEKI